MEEMNGNAPERLRLRPPIYVPTGWGTGISDTQSPDYILQMLDPELSQAVEKRRQIEKRVREDLARQGVQFIEMASPDDADLESGFTESGARIPQEEELKFVGKIAPALRIPQTLRMKEYLSKPFLPALVMVPGLSQGAGKFYIESEEQLTKLSTFLAKNEDGQHLANVLVVKQFIPTPGDRYTSYRVLVDAEGNIIASALIYSGVKKSEPEFVATEQIPGLAGGELTSWLSSAKSEFYLASKRVISNVSGGGGCIPLSPGERSRAITEEEKVIAEENGLGDGRLLAPDITQAAQEIGKHLGRRMGLFVGIDFLRGEDGQLYYLETNAGPGLKTYVAAEMGGRGTETEAYERVLRETIIRLTK